MSLSTTYPGMQQQSMPIATSPAPASTELEFTETRSIVLKWRINGLRQHFEASKADTKSKCIKSAPYDDGRWQLYFYANSGVESHMGLYLAALPTSDERHPDGSWQRAGHYRFCFDLKGTDGSTFRSMEAQDHCFSSENCNWGWNSYWKRAEAYYSNHRARVQDAFVVVCTIHCAPAPPLPARPVDQRLIPMALLEAYASLFNDPAYSDVVFRVPVTTHGKPRFKRIYASRKILAMRSDYFQSLFNGGWAEGTSEDGTAADDSSMMIEDEVEGEADASGGVGDFRSFQQLLDANLGEEIEADEDFDLSRIMAPFTESRASTPQLDAKPFPDSRDSSATVEASPPSRAGSKRTSGVDATTAAATQAFTSALPPSGSDDTLPQQVFSTPKSPQSPEDVRKPPSVPRSASIQRRTRITVVDSTYEAYHALLCWLYTDIITFRPLNSVYYANRLLPAIPASSAGTLRDFHFSTATSAQIAGLNGKRIVAPCSAKSIYTLADKLGLMELKSRALEHIQRSLTPSLIAFEVFSAFSARFPEVQAQQVEYLLEHWSEVRSSAAMREVFDMVGKGNGSWPAFSGVFQRILPSLDYKPRPAAPPAAPTVSPLQLAAEQQRLALQAMLQQNQSPTVPPPA